MNNQLQLMPILTPLDAGARSAQGQGRRQPGHCDQANQGRHTQAANPVGQGRRQHGQGGRGQPSGQGPCNQAANPVGQGRRQHGQGGRCQGQAGQPRPFTRRGGAR